MNQNSIHLHLISLYGAPSTCQILCRSSLGLFGSRLFTAAAAEAAEGAGLQQDFQGPQGQRHVLRIPLGPEQLLVWVNGDLADPLLLSPPTSAEFPTSLVLPSSLGRPREGRKAASLPCHFLCGSLTGPVFQTSCNKNKPIK